MAEVQVSRNSPPTCEVREAHSSVSISVIAILGYLPRFSRTNTRRTPLCVKTPTYDALSIPQNGSMLAACKEPSGTYIYIYMCHLNIGVDPSGRLKWSSMPPGCIYGRLQGDRTFIASIHFYPAPSRHRRQPSSVTSQPTHRRYSRM